MGVFRIGGIASGIDFNNVIDQLMALERRPINQMKEKQQLLSWKKEAWSGINSALSNLNKSVETLLKSSTMLARITSTTDDEKATATATSEAATGTYTLTINNIATSTILTGGDSSLDIGIGGKIDADKAVSSSSSKFGTNITAGTFTVNGVIFTLSDNDSDSIVDKLTIAGITHEFTHSGGGGLTLNDIITAFNYNDGTDNVPSVVGLSTAGDAASYNSTTDKFKLKGASSLNLGSGGDTSNFLTAVSLLNAELSGTSKESVTHLGAIRLSQPLADAYYSTSLTTDSNGDGKFKINGVEITFNKNTDSMQTVINRINASTAGVIATYDSIRDRLVLTNKNTGNTGITRESLSSSGNGNFLEVTDLLTGASESLGSKASFSMPEINGGSTIYSQSNDVSSVATGVTFNLKEATAAGTPVKITISQDKTKAKDAIKDFVNNYNAAIELVNAKLSEERVKDAKLEADKRKGLLRGDSELTNIKNNLVSKATAAVSGLSASLDQLYEIGITLTSEDYGKASTLVLNETTLDEKLNENPAAVASLFFSDTDGDGKIDSGEVGVAATLSTYMDTLLDESGKTTTTRTEETDTTNLTYSGIWSTQSHSSASGGSYKQSNTAGNYAEFTFTGNKVVWYATKNSTMGTAKVYMDGVYKETVNLNSATEAYKQAIYTASDLDSKSHTIKIEVEAGYVNIDALDVTYTSATGTIERQQSTIQDQVDDIDDSVESMERRLAKREETLIKQFTAMEKAIQKLKDMSSRLQSQLSSMLG